MTASQRDLIRSTLTESERVAFEAALAAEGLEDEIALLRVWLREAFEEEKVEPKVLSAGMSTLVRAVAAQYRMSPKQAQTFADSVADVLGGIGSLVLPPDH